MGRRCEGTRAAAHDGRSAVANTRPEAPFCHHESGGRGPGGSESRRRGSVRQRRAHGLTPGGLLAGHGAFSPLKVGGWRLAVGGGWRRLAAVGGWRLLAVGGWWRLAVVGGWRLLAVGGWWRLAAVGGWRLVVPTGCP